MSYGERKRSDGTLERFVLVGNDLYNFSADRMSGPSRGRIGGGEVIVVDVPDPDSPYVRGRTPGTRAAGAVTTSTHTVQCLDTACAYAYNAGAGSKFSLVDLRDPNAPREGAT